MANELRFDGKVAIVTGAGNGLGRSHALLLASRGAKVVVNDLGGSMHGGGRSSAAADAVVQQIKDAGGQAVANYDSVEDGENIVKTALDTFGRIDILINNAGILRDTSFQKMSEDDWNLILKVHVNGAYKCTAAVWNIMRDQGYGRIIMTASAAGIYGNFGQANYALAKLGLVGFGNTLALEGKKKNVHVNVIAPIAGSRLTETVLPKELIDALKPEYVSPLAAWLVHEDCKETGGLFEVGGGFIGKLRWERTEGKTFKLGREITPDAVAKAWGEVTDFGKTDHPTDITSSMGPILGNIQSKSRGGNDLIDLDEAFDAPPIEAKNSYDERDAALYGLSIGAAQDPTDTKDLQYVYEMHGDGFRVAPTFGVIPALGVVMQMAKEGKQAPGMKYGFDRVLHGEQYTEVKRPLPPKANLRHVFKVKDIFDKGRSAVVVNSITTYDADSGEELVYNELTTFVRGAGGWGGDRGPQGEVNVPPERAADATITEKTNANQALLYRLTGDWNPLHADPSFAKAFGFDRPILHGLCTFGFVARHVIKAVRGQRRAPLQEHQGPHRRQRVPGRDAEDRDVEGVRHPDHRPLLGGRARQGGHLARRSGTLQRSPAAQGEGRAGSGEGGAFRRAHVDRDLPGHRRVPQDPPGDRAEGPDGLLVQAHQPEQRVARRPQRGQGRAGRPQGRVHARDQRRRLHGADRGQGRRAEAVLRRQAEDQRERDGLAEARDALQEHDARRLGQGARGRAQGARRRGRERSPHRPERRRRAQQRRDLRRDGRVPRGSPRDRRQGADGLPVQAQVARHGVRARSEGRQGPPRRGEGRVHARDQRRRLHGADRGQGRRRRSCTSAAS